VKRLDLARGALIVGILQFAVQPVLLFAQEMDPTAPTTREGVVVEPLAGTPPLPFGSATMLADLARYTFQPTATHEFRYAEPLLLYVEAGTMLLEGVGTDVSILSPVREDHSGSEKRSAARQVGEAPAAGSDVTVTVGGSAYAGDGNLGLARNRGAEPLVLLVLFFTAEPDPSSLVVDEPEGIPAATPVP